MICIILEPDAGEKSRSVDTATYYGQIVCLLTGENHEYLLDWGLVDRVRPRRPVTEQGGIGAWEAALRYTRVHLDSKEVYGGCMDDLTVGLNWYLTTDLRKSWNYVITYVQEVGNVNSFQMRIQFCF